jgi:DNA replication and repair protein RecF
MHLTNLSLAHFRSFSETKVTFDPAINIVYGTNGSGKTSLLEAVFVLLLGRSQRGAPDNVMLRENQAFYRLEGDVLSGDKRDNIAAAYQKNGRKKLTIDGLPVRASEMFRRYCAVSIAPEDIEILKGGPSTRRAFLDMYLSQASPDYLAVLGDYQRALAQKNAFLKQERVPDENPYDDLLVDYGVKIIAVRRRFLEALKSPVADIYRRLASGQDLTLTYTPSVTTTSSDIEDLKNSFRQKLKQYREKEKVLQSALVGPHRDDFEITIGMLPARAFGSQGELRSAAVSLKLALFEYLKEVRRVTPVLLLDEIFAELDDVRREKLVASLDKYGQLFLTTASEGPLALFGKARTIHIENGGITEK